MNATTSALRLDGLTKRFGDLTVTNDVTLEVAPGTCHAIIGPNGAGKTSLINQIGGALRPDAGRIFLNGKDVTHLPPYGRSRRGLGRTFQKNNLFDRLSVLENVRLAVQVERGNPLSCWSPVTSHRNELQRAEELLVAVGLAERLSLRVSHLSYGEQRQLEVALALATRPTVILMDEPTSGMSSAETDAMTRLVGGLGTDLSIILVEHDMDVVYALARTVTVLHYGSVLVTGTPREVSQDPRVREVYLGSRQQGARHA